jgi:hypothetical protein
MDEIPRWRARIYLGFFAFFGLIFVLNGVILVYEATRQFGWTETSGLVVEDRGDDGSVIRFVSATGRTREFVSQDHRRAETTVTVHYPADRPELATTASSLERVIGLSIDATFALVVGAAVITAVFWGPVSRWRARRELAVRGRLELDKGVLHPSESEWAG